MSSSNSKKITYSFIDSLKTYPSDGGATWYYISVPEQYFDELREFGVNFKKGFGSIKVEAKTKATVWRTSVFPDTKSGSYILFIKKQVRKENSVDLGDTLAVEIELLLPESL